MTMFTSFKNLCHLAYDKEAGIVTHADRKNPSIKTATPIKEVTAGCKHFEQMYRVAEYMTQGKPTLTAGLMADFEGKMSVYLRSKTYIFLASGRVVSWRNWKGISTDTNSYPGIPCPVTKQGSVYGVTLCEWELNYPGVTPVLTSLLALNVENTAFTEMLKQQILTNLIKPKSRRVAQAAILPTELTFD